MTTGLKGWREKLDNVLGDDVLENIDPLGSRPQVLDEEGIIEPAAPPLPQPQLTAAIGCQADEVSRAFHHRKEAGRPAEPGAAGSVRQVGEFDDAKLARFEADMLKRFADKVRHRP